MCLGLRSKNPLTLLTGMWSSTFYFGNFLGPTSSGFMVENFGFTSTTFIFFCIYTFIVFLDSCQLAYILKYNWAPQREGYSSLDGRNDQSAESALSAEI